ncbi:hypothetical protein [Methylobacterium dankookense]|jgi:hypothetical protein|uniref:Uncharacterized protein n=1 Tax=Methylobacterium dankookense TaxID=560405 RepID=A0A564G553_9HYPH|nr:hypothetical protein [Methylobacterium dankookense]GJD59026.1 hypothetical protein IFDJLNFL_4952 [Methylobacterium dankookense]VUF15447.1 hypothetical protein MTDSW087_05187 [Methylobacterium dankookense]
MPKTIHITEIDPRTAKNAFGDGLTFSERFRRGLDAYIHEERLDQMEAQVVADMSRLVESGEYVAIVSDRGIVGYQSSKAPTALSNAERAAAGKRVRKRQARSGRPQTEQ